MKTIDDSDQMTPRTNDDLDGFLTPTTLTESAADPLYVLVAIGAVGAVCIPLLALAVFLIRLGWRLAALVVP